MIQPIQSICPNFMFLSGAAQNHSACTSRGNVLTGENGGTKGTTTVSQRPDSWIVCVVEAEGISSTGIRDQGAGSVRGIWGINRPLFSCEARSASPLIVKFSAVFHDIEAT